ncbi:MAG: U32 family peptidase [Clostridium sp.]|nr:U32 family peptidase [Clostridium sp.]MCM1444341.1 U32 family peptidase [Candidatus Amulumruptor caecigallinarius]
MKKPELLAPVGSMECLNAAISAGCDAIYLSGKKYGARAFANNFTNSELIDAINISHLYGVKVYVTVNTLIFEHEVNDFLEYIDFLHKNSVDAIIIQDIGMLDLIRKTYPNLEIHASTQMNIHTLEGVLFLQQLGVKRVVLSREVDIEEVKKIKENTNIEIEIFAHGALCVSYSGQCLMSYLIGKRSGNRGECAGSCRLPYKLISNEKSINNFYPLSMKDLNTLNYIDKFIDIGVDSLKIEGRMKRPEYVYLIVSLYKKAIDSYIKNGNLNVTNDDIKEMKKIFNREFTKGFIFNESIKNIVNDKRPNHQGIEIGKVVGYKDNLITIKLSDNLSINDGIRILDCKDIGFIVTSMFKNKKRINKAYKNDLIDIKVNDFIKKNSVVVKTTDYNQLQRINKEISIKKKILISCNVEAIINKNIRIEYSDGINSVSILGPIINKAINSPVTNEKIKEQLSKLGDTVYEMNDFKIKSDNNIFVNIKDLNFLRRQLVEMLNNKRMYKTNYLKRKYEIKVPYLKQKHEFNLEVFNEEIYNYLKEYKFDKIYINFNKDINDSRVIFKMPRIINKYINLDSNILVGDIGSLCKYKNIETDFSLNVTNSYSVAFLHRVGVKKVTLSYEVTGEMINSIYNNYINRYNCEPNIEVIIASRKEAMVSKFNLNQKYNMTSTYLLDKFNEKYPILERDNLMYIYGSKFEFNKFDLNINKRIIVNFKSDITDELIKFINN